MTTKVPPPPPPLHFCNFICTIHHVIASLLPRPTTFGCTKESHCVNFRANENVAGLGMRLHVHGTRADIQ